MENQIFKLIGLYFVYYIAVPALVALVLWKVKEKGQFIKTFLHLNNERRAEFSNIVDRENGKLKKLQVLLVVVLLISIPILNLTFYGLQDISMRRSRNYLSDQTIFPAHIDRVGAKIGPTFDSEDAIERMEESEGGDWYVDDIREQIDLDELTKIPGRMTVYQVRQTQSDFERIVINYAYLSPLPITRSIEFVVIKGRAFLEADRVVAYPMPPSIATPS